MDTTIRNLDEQVYRRFRAHAMTAGLTIGDALNAAMRSYLAQPQPAKTASLLDLEPEAYPDGSETLSTDIDHVVYGT